MFEKLLALTEKNQVLLEQIVKQLTPAPTPIPEPKPTPEPKPVPTPTEGWEMMLTDKGWIGMPLNVEMPGDKVDATPEWAGWLTGVGENGTESREYASLTIQQRGNLRKMICRVWNTMRKEGARLVMHDVGARAFYDRRWHWWGDNFLNRTARIRARAVYPKPFTLPNGAGTFCQVFWEFKTLEDHRPTAIQVLLHKGDDGQLYHYLQLADKVFGLDNQIEPLQFGVPVQYELQVEFKKTLDAKVTLYVNGKLIATGTGRTLNPGPGGAEGYGNGALLLYTNELQDQNVSVEYDQYTVERKVA